MDEAWGESSDSFVLDGGFLLLFVGIPLLLLVCGAITATKGRWGWLLVGVLTTGLIWPVTAFLTAAPDSTWARMRRRTQRP